MLKKIFNLPNITLLTALALSTTAAWFAIVGLMTIFPAKATAILVMGTFIEIGKIVATIWLREYWNRSGWQFKVVLMPMVCILMLLTSMGTFGFLSGAHSEQSAVSGDVAAKVALLDEKVKTQRDNIDLARKALQQMDEQVNQRLSRGDSEQGAERAVQIRRQQGPERARLQKEIVESQSIIAKLNEERAPIASQLRKVEAEIGPIKYIAALVYGDNPDANTLERAVRWVIILLVVVFDPLAIALVLAGNASRKWVAEDEETTVKSVEPIVPIAPPPQDTKKVDEPIEPPKNTDDFDISKHPYLFKTPENLHPPGIELAGPQVYRAEQSDTTINCLTCGTELEYVGGLGSFCPNQECGKTTGLTPLEDTPMETPPVEEPKNEEQTFIEDVKKPKDIINEYLRAKPESRLPKSGFGVKFPLKPYPGDTFVRVDSVPNRLYKYNGAQWVNIDRTQSDAYLYNDDYIRFLIEKIDSREYEVDMLTDYERDQIRIYLNKFQKNSGIAE